MKKTILILVISLIGVKGFGQNAPKICVGCADDKSNLLVAEKDQPTRLKWEDAIKACKSKGAGWVLPSQNELAALYKNRNEIGGFQTENHDANDSNYWSSTEENEKFVWVQLFSSSFKSNKMKQYTHRVRCVKKED